MIARRFLNQNVQLTKAIDELQKKYSGSQDRPKIVVLGTGWASVGFLAKVDRRLFDITVVSPTPYFTFNPLLPSVVGGALAEDSARTDIAALVNKGIVYKKDLATAVDTDGKVIKTQSGEMIPYDYLVYAIGTTNNTFGIPGVAEHSFFLKEWADAPIFRNHIIEALDEARTNLKNLSCEELKCKLHFAIIGAGPTGTEVTAELIDLINSDYSLLKPYVKLTLVDMMNRVLPMYSNKTSTVTFDNLKASGIVEVLLTSSLTNRTKDSITLKQKLPLPESLTHLVTKVEPLQGGGAEYTIKCPTVLWSSGVTQRPLTHELISKQMTDSTARRPPGVKVDQALRAIGMKDIFVLGDNAFICPTTLTERAEEIIRLATESGIDTIEAALQELKPLYPQISNAKLSTSTLVSNVSACRSILEEIDAKAFSPPPTAQNANQQGEYLARVFNRHGPSSEGRPSFVYQHKGSMCYIGNDRAIIEIDKDSATGIYGTPCSGHIWRSFYSMGQKTWPKKVAVITDFARHWAKRRLRLA